LSDDKAFSGKENCLPHNQGNRDFLPFGFLLDIIRTQSLRRRHRTPCGNI